MPTITVIGLGPAEPALLTADAAAALSIDRPLYLRTARHPGADPLVKAGAIALDHHYEAAATFAATYEAIQEELVAAAAEHGAIAYAVPGSPLVLETTVELLLRDPRVEIEIVPGLSFLDLCWARLRLDPVNAGVTLVDAEEFATAAAGRRGPFLVAQAWSPAQLSEVKLAFDEPPNVRPVLLHHLGLPDEVVVEVDFADLDRTLIPDHLTCCYLPVLERPGAAELVRADAVVHELRVACPWDAAQTHASLVRHLLEESCEAIEAIEALASSGAPGDGPDEPDNAAVEHLCEELGDVLCQVLLHATIAEEEGWFSLADVAASLADKLVRRHPHVYGETRADADAVVASWEQQKAEEKGRTSLLDGIPEALPALAWAAKLEQRVGSLDHGTEADTVAPEDVTAVLDGDVGRAGPVLLATARAVARAGGDPEAALRQALRAASGRVREAERRARELGSTLAELDEAARAGLLADRPPPPID